MSFIYGCLESKDTVFPRHRVTNACIDICAIFAEGADCLSSFSWGAEAILYLIDKVNLIIMSKTLKRSSNSMIAGVCAGVANYFDIDPTVVRILWVIFTLCGGAGILLYIIMLVLMPK